jgi:peptidoglycan-N-acetylglucosamine deacetylase
MGTMGGPPESASPAAPARLSTVGRRLASAAARATLGTLSHVVTAEAVAALTFDDGPDPESTPRLLELLARHEVRATFFMLGVAAQRHPDLVRQVAEAGHAIGNHSWDHPSFPFIGGRERRRQIRACAAALAPYGARLLRPPYGYQDLASRLDAWWLGYRVIGWSLDVGDWYRDDGEGMAKQLLREIRPGSVVLLHDTLFVKPAAEREHVIVHEPRRPRDAMLAAVSGLLAGVEGTLRFVTVPELLRYGWPVRRNWYVKDAADWEKLAL